MTPRLEALMIALEGSTETPSDGRTFLRTIRTTAGELVERVKALFCLTCEGLGYVAGAEPWDEDRECVDCGGSGY